jgi:nucleotide-binding universal stress UspA family protein
LVKGPCLGRQEQGVLDIKRIIVGVSGSPRCLPALRFAADLARAHDATLVTAMAWVPPGGDLADRASPSPFLRYVWTEAAELRLKEAISAAFGGPPELVTTERVVQRGEAGRVLAGLAGQAGDVLVIGSGRQGWPGRVIHGQVGRYLMAHATCPLLAIPPPALRREPGLRAWAFRRRGLTASDIVLPTNGHNRQGA